MAGKTDKYAWFQWFPRDWMNEYALRACSPAARGVWIDALCIMWDAPERGTLTCINDDKIAPMPCEMLAAIMRIECAMLASLFDELLANGVCSKRSDGTIYSRRMVRLGNEIATRRECASNAARMRWSCDNDADAMHKSRSQEVKKSEDPPLPPKGEDAVPEPSSKSKAGSLSKIQEARFDAFWTEYPKRVGKGAAVKAWSKVNPDDGLFRKILAAVQAQKTWEQWTKDGGQYIPNPATWLNQGRWDDERPDSPKPTAQGHGGVDMDTVR